MSRSVLNSQRIGRIAVVVPARDEQRLLAGCLEAVAKAATNVPVPVIVVVALDRCRDATADVVAARPDVVAVRCEAGAVGVARALGASTALSHLHPHQRSWLACTDADSRVPPDWLAHQLALADDGVDLVLGTVDLPSGDERRHSEEQWRRQYSRLVGDATHAHVHGANLGVRASTYVAVGGFAAVSAHEDVLFARAVGRLPGASVVPTVAVPVVTSERRVGRAPSGVAADLRHLDAEGRGWESTA